MTSTNRIYFNRGFYAYQTKARNPGNTVVATNTVFDLLMISYDLEWPKWPPKMKMFQLCLYAYQSKARNPRNTVAATNSVFDLLMTSNDLNDLQKWKCFNYGFMHIKLCYTFFNFLFWVGHRELGMGRLPSYVFVFICYWLKKNEIV